MFYVYIHSRPDGVPFYVGKGSGNRSRSFGQRNAHHKHIVAKYGVDSILIHEYACDTETFAFELERMLIRGMRMVGTKLCNQTDGGEGASGLRVPKSTEHKAAISRAKTGVARAPFSKEWRDNMSASRMGKRGSEKQRQLVIARNKAVSPEIRLRNATLASAAAKAAYSSLSAEEVAASVKLKSERASSMWKNWTPEQKATRNANLSKSMRESHARRKLSVNKG